MSATITTLPQRVAALADELRTVCNEIFAIGESHGALEMPPSMLAWAEQQFGSIDSVAQQTIIKVVNRLTLEGALFNPLRAKRPAMHSSDDAELEAWIAAELRDDIFADPLRTTPADRFGRIRGAHCISASNIAKYDGWHGVVIFDEPHPLRFERAHVRDYLDVAWRWIEAAHAADQQAVYPMITWNCLPKSGASLAHGHMQVALGRGMAYTRLESWRRAAVGYQAASGREYFADLALLHHALGLALPEQAGIARFAHLTPLRNREIVLVEQHVTPCAPRTLHLADALYDTLRGLIDGQSVRAFNVALAFPPLAADGHDWRGVPAFARLGDRGNPLTFRNDVGVMELYGTGVITVDPFLISSKFKVQN